MCPEKPKSQERANAAKKTNVNSVPIYLRKPKKMSESKTKTIEFSANRAKF